MILKLTKNLTLFTKQQVVKKHFAKHIYTQPSIFSKTINFILVP